MAEIADGTLPPHTIYAEMRGYLDRKYLSQNNYLYIPIREGAEPATPAHTVVGVDDGKMRTEITRHEDGSVTVRGMLEPRLDSEVRYAFEKNGMTLANPCWILRTSRTPGTDKTVGGILMLVGMIYGGVLVLRRSRRTPKPAPLRMPQSAGASATRSQAAQSHKKKSGRKRKRTGQKRREERTGPALNPLKGSSARPPAGSSANRSPLLRLMFSVWLASGTK